MANKGTDYANFYKRVVLLHNSNWTCILTFLPDVVLPKIFARSGFAGKIKLSEKMVDNVNVARVVQFK